MDLHVKKVYNKQFCPKQAGEIPGVVQVSTLL